MTDFQVVDDLLAHFGVRREAAVVSPSVENHRDVKVKDIKPRSETYRDVKVKDIKARKEMM